MYTHFFIDHVFGSDGGDDPLPGDGGDDPLPEETITLTPDMFACRRLSSNVPSAATLEDCLAKICYGTMQEKAVTAIHLFFKWPRAARMAMDGLEAFREDESRRAAAERFRARRREMARQARDLPALPAP